MRGESKRQQAAKTAEEARQFVDGFAAFLCVLCELAIKVKLAACLHRCLWFSFHPGLGRLGIGEERGVTVDGDTLVGVGDGCVELSVSTQ